MPTSKGTVTAILKQLGVEVPPPAVLDKAIAAALKEVKIEEGLDPEKVRLKLAVPIDRSWIRKNS